MKKIIFGLTLLCCLILILSFAKAGQQLTLWVTQDFSKSSLLDTKINHTNQSVMQLLKEACEVKTTCAGAFVASINNVENVKTSEQKNWFYYINGIMAHVGAKKYYPEAGDIVWWDFHSWSENAYIPAVIGAYPQPFLSGYAGQTKETIILYVPSLNAKTTKFKNTLEELGAQNIKLKPCNNQALKDNNKILIIVGCWQDLKQYSTIQDVFKNYRKLGLFVKFEDDKLQIMDIYGKKQKEFKKAAAIVATKGGIGLSGLMWLVTGTDDDSVRDALEVLIAEPQKIKFYCAAVLTSGEILNVPLSE